MHLPARLQSLMDDLAHFPWTNTVLTLRERFRDDRLGLTASSLTFTTTIALVPLFTVALAIFTAFPMFGKLQVVLQRWLIDNLVPDTIARQVLGYLTQFAKQASQLGGVGLVILLVTALALILTIDRTLNGIWRVRRKRRLAQRVLVYWAAITLGPLILGASITMTSYAVGLSRGLAGGALGGIGLLLDAVQFLILAGGAAVMYRYVPYTQVKWSHAWAGGLFASVGDGAGQEAAGVLPGQGADLFGGLRHLRDRAHPAGVDLPGLGHRAAGRGDRRLPAQPDGRAVRRGLGAGWQFQLALETWRLLHQARDVASRGLTMPQLAQGAAGQRAGHRFGATALVELDWVARVDDDASDDGPRYVLLVDPADTALEPLVQLLLLRNPSTDAMWDCAALAVRLGEVM